MYNVCRSYYSFSCKYRRYQLQWVACRYWSFTKGRDKGTPLFYNQSFDFHESFFLPFHFFYGNYHTSDSSLKHLLVMGVYARVYPGHTSKKIIVICKFVTFSLLRLGLNTEYCIYSKQLATIAKMLFLLLFARRREKMDNTEGGLIKRNSWKQG